MKERTGAVEQMGWDGRTVKHNLTRVAKRVRMRMLLILMKVRATLPFVLVRPVPEGKRCGHQRSSVNNAEGRATRDVTQVHERAHLRARRVLSSNATLSGCQRVAS